MSLLDQAGIRFLVIHKQFANEGLQAAWRAWLAIEPFYEDGELLVYRTAPQFGADFFWTYPLTDSLGLLEARFNADFGRTRAELLSPISPGPRPLLRLKTIASAYVCAPRMGRPLRAPVQRPIPPSQQALGRPMMCAARSWCCLSRWISRRARILLKLYLVQAAGDAQAGETAVLGQHNHPALCARTYGGKQPGTTAFYLLGYNQQTAGEALQLQLYWRTETPLETSYKVFVHLVDRQTGTITAQSDTIPRDWGYPTNRWQPGEIVCDPVALPLGDVPAGLYHVAVGLYDENTGERALLAEGVDALTLGEWERP